MLLKEKKVSLLMYFIMQCFKLKEITYLTAYFSSDMNVTQFCKKKSNYLDCEWVRISLDAKVL